MNYKFYGILGLVVVLNSLANIILKWAVNNPADTAGGNMAAILKAILFNYWAWAGIALLGLAFLFYSLALTRINLNIAYPFMSTLSLVVITVVSFLGFHEVLGKWQIMGLVLIMAGVWLVSAGAGKGAVL